MHRRTWLRLTGGAACAGLCFALGRYGRPWWTGEPAPVASDGKTHLLPRERLPEGQLAYPTGRRRDLAWEDPVQGLTPPWPDVVEQVRPACAIVGSGSGVCIHPRGDILTNAHVALALSRDLFVQFADGGRLIARCWVINHKLDLALLGVHCNTPLPHARLAQAMPPPGAQPAVLCIGHPAQTQPDGRPSPYQPFHVSLGRIIAQDPDPLGEQSLGRVQHDAWTYWGHSGAPLFDETGCIVALHNSWQPDAGTRHAVPLAAIEAFLDDAGVATATVGLR